MFHLATYIRRHVHLYSKSGPQCTKLHKMNNAVYKRKNAHFARPLLKTPTITENIQSSTANLNIATKKNDIVMKY